MLRSVTVMYKNGDDLRQDHLVCQLVSVVDRLLKDSGLDLKVNRLICNIE